MRWIVRYTAGERINHWIVAGCFLLAGLSGLALFHPSLFWLSALFGGGPWTKTLHPFLGLAMVIAFILLAAPFWRLNLFGRTDRQWLRQWRDVVGNHEERLPEVGKYNAGQKAVFWVAVLCLALLLATGFVFWRPWFAPLFPIWLVRAATVVHAASAV